jgi:perosamine synthetase
MQAFIPLASPDIQEQDLQAVNEVLRSGNLVQGKQVEALEQALAHYLNVEHCILLTNGTATLHLMLVALGIGPGDEVVIPAFSYIATANVVELVGARPVFVDISLDTFNINTTKIEAAITSRTKAVMVVHEFGLSADMAKIKAICDAHQIPLLEDAACALGAKEGERFAGTTGLAGSFSFHPRKAITSGEGGAVVTNDAELARKIRTLRNHGIDAGQSGKMDFVAAGYNCRMTDFQAALLHSQFKRLESTLSRKRAIAQRYLTEMKHLHIQLPVVPDDKLPSWQTFHVVLQEPLNQAKTIQQLREKGIGANYGAQCMPAQTFFAQKYQHQAELEFPQAYTAFRCGLAIPLYEKLSDDQVSYLIQSVNNL